MSKKITQNQPITEEVKTALAIEANGKDTEVLAVTEETKVTLAPEQEVAPKAPTYDERLATFKDQYAKLITATYEDTFNLLYPIVDQVTNGQLNEHPDVINAKSAIAELNAKLGELSALPDDIKVYAEIGIRAEVAKYQAQIESLKGVNPLADAMIERFWFRLYDAGLIKFGKTSKRRAGGARASKPQIEDADVWPFSYKTSRALKDGTTFEVDLTEGYIFGHAHPKVVEAKVPNPSDKVIITNREGLIMGHLSKTLSKSMLLGQSVAIVADLDESAPAKVSETGISGLSNGRTKELLRSIPAPHVAILSNGKNSELATVGSKAQTEKETA